MRLKEIIHSPLYMAENPWKKIPVTASIVTLCLFLSHPWGDLNCVTNLWISLLSGVISALVEGVYYALLPRIFPKWFDAEQWTVGKQVASATGMLFTIAAVTYAFFVVCFHMPVSLRVLSIFTLFFLLITPLPLIFALIWNRNLELQRNLRLANRMNERIMSQTSSDTAKEKMVSSEKALIFPNGRNAVFTVSPNHLLFISSEGNYVNIAFITEGKYKEKLLRCTMKTVEEQTDTCTDIIRCHRSFFVNLSKVKMVTGNAQECLLHFNETRQSVPVSRRFRKEIIERTKREQ